MLSGRKRCTKGMDSRGGESGCLDGHALEPIVGPFLAGGSFVTKYGHNVPLKKLQIMEPGHPLPDDAGIAAASQIISLAENQSRRAFGS